MLVLLPGDFEALKLILVASSIPLDTLYSFVVVCDIRIFLVYFYR